MNSKRLGGMLLIVGTSIGGGMLALPVATAAVGLQYTVLFLFLCWLLMTAGALLLLEVNLRLPAGSNMISMAGTTLGRPGQILAWISYLFLLYTLLSAYISGGSDVFMGILRHFAIELPSSLSALLFTFLFGFIIYSGIRAVDYCNRALMFGKLGIYLLLIILISPHMQWQALQGGDASAVSSSLMILVASFGFASIVPSLRDYFQDDIKGLRYVIVLGSLIPLVCYILWEAVIMGVVQKQGPQGLLALMQSEHATSGLTLALSQVVQNPWITALFSFFTSICMLTAFLGVSMGLFDFLADGLGLEKHGSQGKFTLALTFLPPLGIVLLYPGIYLQALSYAGICCVILLLLLPSAMAWQSRKGRDKEILLPGGPISLICIALAAFYLLYINFFFI